MKASELRIGNWIDLGGQRNLHRVEDEILGCLNLNPIPLTEEWLFKFGYHKKLASNVGVDYDCGHGIVRVIKYNERIRAYRSWNNEYRLNAFSWGKTRIDYVHQLQNLYFALTNEELTIIEDENN